jgi:tetratricopeptide (TPR) repeat protein
VKNKAPLSYFFCLIAIIIFEMISARNILAQNSLSGGTASRNAGINRGIELFGQGKWDDAIYALRKAQLESGSGPQRAEAQFWIAMTDFQAGHFLSAINDFDEIAILDPTNLRLLEVPYHKARAYFYLGRYDEAIPFFKTYADGIRLGANYSDYTTFPDTVRSSNYNKKASAIFWMGECYYALGEFQKAEEVFGTIIESYRKSHKYEESVNRIALLRQKKVQAELLDLLQYSREEKEMETRPVSPLAGRQEMELRREEEVETRQNYDEAVIAYKNRIAPYLVNKAMAEDAGNIRPYSPNAATPAVSDLSGSGTRQPAIQPDKTVTKTGMVSPRDPDAVERLLSVKMQALDLMEKLVTSLNSYDTIEEDF